MRYDHFCKNTSSSSIRMIHRVQKCTNKNEEHFMMNKAAESGSKSATLNPIKPRLFGAVQA